ncbi:PALP domain containing protein [Trichuris trichiura]|uniref:L-serine ammonia-lyase n=1 Tax=Trichuris trichiura TaxID=36087 RepID=A0A077ZCB4_TRITR|nr:PALP domain containing protein [Trichuris trichiura]
MGLLLGTYRPSSCMEPSLKKQLENEWFTIEELRSSFSAIKANPMYRRTPVLVDCADMLALPGFSVDLKMESMQVSGSYKLRGIVWQLEKLKAKLEAGRHCGLVTMSAGNYGISLAICCRNYGIPCRVVMPDTSPQYKRQLVASLGAEQLCCQASNMSALLDESQANGWLLSHPFDDLNLVCGYGTILMELMDTIGLPDVVVVPAGPFAGGGLLCGIALAARLLELPTKVFGVEVVPSESNEKFKHCSSIGSCVRTVDSFAGGEMKGLPEKYVGENTFRICFDCVDGVVSVLEDDLINACSVLLDTAGIIVEPFAAGPVAALMTGKLDSCKGEKVVAIIGSRNIELSDLLDRQRFITRDTCVAVAR